MLVFIVVEMPRRRIARNGERDMKLGELIAIGRECKGWTLRDLEKASGVSNPLINQIETGKVKDPGFSTVIRIVDALGISIERAAATARPPLSAIKR